MIPGVDPRQLKAMMKQMGMSQEDLPATRVVIETPDKKYIFENPNVQKITMQGQTTFQLMGNYNVSDVELIISISNDDIKMVASQANVSEAKAKEALEKSNGDIAEAIISLSE